MRNHIFVMGALLITLMLSSACYGVLRPVAPPPAPTLEASPSSQETAPPISALNIHQPEARRLALMLDKSAPFAVGREPGEEAHGVLLRQPPPF